MHYFGDEAEEIAAAILPHARRDAMRAEMSTLCYARERYAAAVCAASGCRTPRCFAHGAIDDRP